MCISGGGLGYGGFIPSSGLNKLEGWWKQEFSISCKVDFKNVFSIENPGFLI